MQADKPSNVLVDRTNKVVFITFTFRIYRIILFAAFSGDIADESQGNRMARKRRNASAAGAVLYIGLALTQSMN